MVAVAPVVVLPPVPAAPPTAAPAVAPDPVLVATLAPVVPLVLDEAAPPYPEVVLADVDVALPPSVPVIPLLEDPPVVDAWSEAVVVLSALASALPFEPSPQAHTRTDANASNERRSRDFMGDLPSAKINHARVANNVPARSSPFSLPRNTHATKIRGPNGPRRWKVFSVLPSRALPRGRQTNTPLSERLAVLGDASPGRRGSVRCAQRLK